MKKYINIMMMALMAVVCLTFTACGGDDDDDIGTGGASVVYVEPCFNWGATIDEVKAWMTGKPWNLEYDQYLLMYSNSNETCSITYMFDTNYPGLYYSMVQYLDYSETKLQGIINETEKRYSTKLTKQVEGQFVGYTGHATINGKYTGVMVSPDSTGSITVIFAIPD